MRSRIWFGGCLVVACIGLVAWVSIVESGYVPEAFNGGRLWCWLAIFIVAGLLATWRSRWIVVALAVLLVMDVSLGFVLRQWPTNNLATSASPTGRYEVAVVSREVGLLDTRLEIRVIRHAGPFDFRYERICGSNIGDQAVVNWLGNERFQVAIEQRGEPITVEIVDNALRFDRVLDWSDC